MGWNCKKCNDYKLDNVVECHCQPFTVIDDEGEEHEVFSFSEWSAALKYAEKSNENGDYYLMDNGVDITVNGKAYHISAEPDIHYSATEL